MVVAVKNTLAQQELDLSQFGASQNSYQNPCAEGMKLTKIRIPQN